MLRTSFSWLFLSLLAFATAACCGSVACDNREKNADTLFFRFAPSVTDEAIETVYIVRTYTPKPNAIPTPTPGPPVRDTARLISTAADSSTNRNLAIGNNTPFVATANRKLNAYTYEIYTPNPADTTGKTKVLRFDITNVQLQGGFNDEDGCCTYYMNTLKTIDLYNGRTLQSGIDLNKISYAPLVP
ncbi:hypothetical protein MUN82_01745 [Hymenobacter aerilatus]|uniref:Lipoprotein n=1 Tax=Hymenobacter aerilatus TaxID=2932251 RepID=A0A8T9SYM0_9BACT|nr:hypothetical protein [Hymenobacter aerilatus]UOR05833.1 hypothetical protein MUN82_01745 [Hymenobacter aerilatus]